MNGGQIGAAPAMDLWLLEQARCRIAGTQNVVREWTISGAAESTDLYGSPAAIAMSEYGPCQTELGYPVADAKHRSSSGANRGRTEIEPQSSATRKEDSPNSCGEVRKRNRRYSIRNSDKAEKCIIAVLVLRHAKTSVSILCFRLVCRSS
jgi:hypothetical protein